MWLLSSCSLLLSRVFKHPGSTGLPPRSLITKPRNKMRSTEGYTWTIALSSLPFLSSQRERSIAGHQKGDRAGVDAAILAYPASLQPETLSPFTKPSSCIIRSPYFYFFFPFAFFPPSFRFPCLNLFSVLSFLPRFFFSSFPFPFSFELSSALPLLHPINCWCGH